jgi:hypothetical protein
MQINDSRTVAAHDVDPSRDGQELSDTDLSRVSGGINPQPEPPGMSLGNPLVKASLVSMTHTW